MDTELSQLSSIHSDFYGNGVSAMDSSKGLLKGRPHGGLAILWRKTLGSAAIPCYYDDVRIMGLHIDGDDNKLLIVNTYLPTSSPENLEEFVMYLNKLDSIVMTSETVYNIILGDFNSDIKASDHLFGNVLVSFCDDNNMLISDKLRLHSNNTYTYVSHAHGTTSWLDHVVSSANADDLISDINIEYNYVSSDHLPLCVCLDFSRVEVITSSSGQAETRKKVSWEKLSDRDIARYSELTAEYISNADLPFDLLMCNDPLCNVSAHRVDIDSMYDKLLTFLKSASHVLSTEKHVQRDVKQIPGWNAWVKEHHSHAREAFLDWRAAGSPRDGLLFQAMKQARARFKLALRQCRRQKNRWASDALAQKLLQSDSKIFWQEVNKVSGKNVRVQASTINGITGEKDITEMWRQHYCTLLNSSRDVGKKQQVLNSLESITICDEDLFQMHEVESAIHNLKKGKSPGKDGLSSEHFIYSSKKVVAFLCLIFNCMIKHGHVPSKFMDTILVPLVKDKKDRLTDKNNYRPIAVTCVASKVFEPLIFDKVGHLLVTNSHQFGFKKKHSTDQCTFVLKQVIEFYNSLSTPVYACYIDAAKAFDKVNHWHLLSKLLCRQIPRCFIRILMNWFTTQSFIVRWGSCYSDSFTVRNGVRQSGIISLYLFSVYVEDLSNELLSIKVGCFINRQCMNHLFYADDAVLLAPTVGGLQKLIDVCQEFAKSNDMCYNYKKSKCCAFIPPILGNLYTPKVSLGDKCLVWVDEHKYLGTVISSNCTDDCDIGRQTQSVFSRGNILIRKFNACSDDVKTELFKSYLYSMYGMHLWNSFSNSSLYKLKIAYNDVFRKLFKIDRRASISAAFVSFNVDCFRVRKRKGVFSFLQRLHTSPNQLVDIILRSVFFSFGSKMYNSWRDCLCT